MKVGYKGVYISRTCFLDVHVYMLSFNKKHTGHAAIYLQYILLMSLFRLLSQNVRDRRMGYFQQMNTTMKEHTPRVMIAVMIPANSNDGTEIKRKM